MDASLLHPSRFLKSAEFRGKDVTYTIRSIELEELEDEQGKKKTKGIVGFAETPKLLVINRTNSDCIKGMFGRETDNWVGKRVTFYPAPFFDNFTKEHTTAIRVRGSPDIKESVTVSVHLPRKKATTVKMTKTGAAPGPLSVDELRSECAAIDEAIDGAPTPEACDAAWTAGLGKRINALPPNERAQKTARFKARKGSTRDTAALPPDGPQ